MRKPIVLISLGHYLPGFKSGGPLRSIINLTRQLEPWFRFRIITADRDLGDDRPYAGIVADRWTEREGMEIRYISPRARTVGGIAAVLRNTPHDLLYLNSAFSPSATLLPLLTHSFGQAPRRPVVLAPRGEFSPGAMTIKTRKKQAYLHLGRKLGLFNGLLWQASTEREATDIARIVEPPPEGILVARDLGALLPAAPPPIPDRQPSTPLRLLFLARISPMKNLDFALDVLARVKTPVELSIHGPVEDTAYWDLCQRKLAALPPNVRAQWLGEAAPQDVPGLMARHDLFFLPSRGENYGHVIAEALAAATPVLISDTTPWRGLAAAGAGHDLPLHRPEDFIRVIESMAGWSPAQHQAARDKAWTYAHRALDSSADIAANRALFERALASK